MALIRTLTILTTTFERMNEKFYGFRRTECAFLTLSNLLCWFSQIFKTKFLFQTLMYRPNINRSKRSIDQNLSWLIENPEQFRFWKTKVWFLRYAPLNSELFYSRGIMVSRAQIEQVTLRRFKFEYMEFTTDSSITYIPIQPLIEQLPLVVAQRLIHAYKTNEHLQLPLKSPLCSSWELPWQCDITEYSSHVMNVTWRGGAHF